MPACPIYHIYIIHICIYNLFYVSLSRHWRHCEFLCPGRLFASMIYLSKSDMPSTAVLNFRSARMKTIVICVHFSLSPMLRNWNLPTPHHWNDKLPYLIFNAFTRRMSTFIFEKLIASPPTTCILFHHAVWCWNDIMFAAVGPLEHSLPDDELTRDGCYWTFNPIKHAIYF